jgi:hypothetical protein
MTTLILFFIGAFFIVIELISPPPPADVLLDGNLSKVQEKTLDISIELSRLFMSWSIALIGAIGYFLRLHDQNSAKLSNFQLLSIEAVILLLIVSIYFGHLSITSLIESLSFDVLSFSDGPHIVYETIQYLTFLFALIVFGGFLHFTYWNVK